MACFWMAWLGIRSAWRICCNILQCVRNPQNHAGAAPIPDRILHTSGQRLEMIHVCKICGAGVEVDNLLSHANEHCEKFGKASWEWIERRLFNAVPRREFEGQNGNQ